MRFVNRKEELLQLQRLSRRKEGGLAVLWGRRRVGKTRLLLEWARQQSGVYYVADESSQALQRKYLALAISEALPGFADVEYPDWRSLFTRLAQEAKRTKWRGPLIIDEFPYLVAASPSFSSVLQGFIDKEAKEAKFLLALCGSSQRMMQGAVLSPSAPLYGRADVLFKLQPISIAYLGEALKLKNPRAIVEMYAVLGGIPRYWELASLCTGNVYETICELVLDPTAPLQEEPNRLLLEETPSALALRPILDTIGLGVHRLSEIATRVEKPATSLSRPMQHLIELDLIYREAPYGHTGSKKALYKIKDPFVRFWFKCIASKRSALTTALRSERIRYLKKVLPALFSQAWEELCRENFPLIAQKWGLGLLEAGRFWQGKTHEWDLVSLGSELVLGEAKWTAQCPTKAWIEREFNALRAKGIPPLARPKNCKVRYCLFIPEKPPSIKLPEDAYLIDAKSLIHPR